MKTLEDRMRFMERARMDVDIRPGTGADYACLARFHYRAGAPATCATVLRLTDADENTIGVLVVSRPTLNGRWRKYAWPGRFDGPDKKRNAARINEELRTISRVVIDPRYRALGLATRLVGAYLDIAPTRATEAVATMGRACPFFERAGMTAYHLAPSICNARLADALHHGGIEPWELVEPRRASALLEAQPWLVRELRLWADSSGATRRHLGEPAHVLGYNAACAIVARPVAYAYGGAS